MAMHFKAVGLMAFSLAALVLLAGIVPAQTSEDPAPGVPDWFEARYDIAIDENLDRVDLTGTVLIRQVSPPDDGPSELERFCGSSCTADELRDVYDRSGESDRETLVESIEDRVAQRTAEALGSVAGSEQGVSTEATLVRATIEQESSGSPYDPPIEVEVTGEAPVGVFDADEYTDAQVQALFQMGARVDVPVVLAVDPGTQLDLTVSVPSPLSILDAQDAELVEDGQAARWTVDNTASDTPASIDSTLTVGRDDVVVPDAEEAEIDVTIDLSNVDVHYGNLLGSGSTASVDVAISVDGTFDAIETPGGGFEQVQLPILSADAIRLALSHGFLDRANLTSFENDARTSVEAGFASSFGQDVPAEGGFVNASLEDALVGDPAGTGPPVQFEMRAASTVPFPPEEGGGANGFEITRVGVGALTLPSVELPGDLPIRYTIVLPSGMDLAYESVDGGEVVEETTVDGRKAYTFQTDPGSDGATVQGSEVVIEHPFLWHVLWPVLLLIFLLLVVLPAAIIFWVIRSRRQEERPVRDPHAGSPGTWQPAPDTSEGPPEGPAGAGQSSEDRGSQGAPAEDPGTQE